MNQHAAAFQITKVSRHRFRIFAGREEITAIVSGLRTGGTYDFAISSIDEYLRPTLGQHEYSQCCGRHNKEGENSMSVRIVMHARSPILTARKQPPFHSASVLEEMDFSPFHIEKSESPASQAPSVTKHCEEVLGSSKFTAGGSTTKGDSRTVTGGGGSTMTGGSSITISGGSTGGSKSSILHTVQDVIAGDLPPDTNEVVVKDGREYLWVTEKCAPEGGLQ